MSEKYYGPPGGPMPAPMPYQPPQAQQSPQAQQAPYAPQNPQTPQPPQMAYPAPHGQQMAAPAQAPAPVQQRSSNSWTHPFFDFFEPIETCLFGWCCPCMLFGQNQARFKNPSDPDPSGLNGDCCLWMCLASLCGCHCFLQTSRRQKMRKQYGIEGSTGTDCLGACCCPLCGLMQESKEIDHRSQPNGPYQTPQGMTYP